ncbi:MAG: GHKL domain-containing protein [Clostridiales bacterium]|nr:GHKL domain-containing protein [Clostridiales bacterium]
MSAIAVIDFSTIPRYYTALAEWLSCILLTVTFHNQRRLHGWRLVGAAAVGLAALELELILTENLPVYLWSVGMAGSAAIMLALLLACLDLRPVEGGYVLTSAFMLAEFAASLSWQLYYYYAAYIIGEEQPVAALVTVLLTYALVFAVYGVLSWRSCPSGRCIAVGRRETLTATVVAVLFFIASNLSFLFPDTPFTSHYAAEIFNIRTLFDLGALAVLFALYFQQQELHARYELDAIQTVLETQYVQYRQSRESIDLINRKYHDLKHQIAALRAEPDPQRRSDWLDAMESDIKVYEAQNKTGNSILDTVLTSKSLYCQKHGISLTTVADGALLDFMDAMDICTIFGNALDNAVESVLKIGDKEKRLIHLSVSGERDFVLIRVENYFEGELTFQEGLPRSTKGDDRFHGFGVKSIRYSAQRYGGTVTVTAERNWFDLKVLIPKNSGKK